MARKLLYVERLNCMVNSTFAFNRKNKDITKTKEFWEKLAEVS